MSATATASCSVCRKTRQVWNVNFNGYLQPMCRACCDYNAIPQEQRTLVPTYIGPLRDVRRKVTGIVRHPQLGAVKLECGHEQVTGNVYASVTNCDACREARNAAAAAGTEGRTA